MIDQNTRDQITEWATDKYASSAAPSLTAAASPLSAAKTDTAPAATGMLGATPSTTTAPAAAAAPASTWSTVATPAAPAAPASAPALAATPAPAAPAPSPAAAPAAPNYDVNSWYRTTLGRDGDSQGVAFWQKQIANGMDPQAAYAEFTKGATTNHELVKPTDWSAANTYTGPQSKDKTTPVDDWGRNVLGRDLTPTEQAALNTRFNAAAATGGPAAVQALYDEFLTANKGQVKNNMSMAEASQINPGFQANPAIAAGPTLIDPSALTHRIIDKPTETVAGQLGSVLAADGPLMQQARAQAMTQANERGMLNSSLAASAGEDAMISSALQVATPDAGYYNHASDYNAAAENQATMYNATTQNDFAKQAIQTAADTAARNAQLGQSMSIAQMQDATSRYNTETTTANSRYNTDAQYKQQAENNKKALVQNIISSTEMSPDRKAAMLASLGEGTSTVRNPDGTITPGTGMAGAVYVIDSTTADLNFGAGHAVNG